METTENIVNKYGQPILGSTDLQELLLRGKNISHTIVSNDEEIELYKQHQAELLSVLTVFEDDISNNVSVDEFHNKCVNEWFIPDEYANIDVLDWLSKRCKTDEELVRVVEEYVLYEERNLIMLLRMFIYLISYIKEKKFICGVGRGSSTCSYILYLIGTHRVNSIRYNLPITDYLK